MASVKRFLLALDFNKSTRSAIKKVEYLAGKCKGEILPVHAVEYVPYHYCLNYWNEMVNKIKPGIEEICRGLTAQKLNVLPPIIKEGRPYDVILTTADENDIDMIVIGAGSRGLAESLLGTTAVKIVRNANQMVFTVPQGEKVPEIKKILCAVDLSLASNEVLNLGIELATGLKAELAILHVVPKAKKYPGLKTCDVPVVDMEVNANIPENESIDAKNFEKIILEKMRTSFNSYLGKIISKKIKFRKLLRQGQPDIEILKAVKKEESDLLIMGNVGQNALSRFLIGNITERVMGKVPCSLITFRHQRTILPGQKELTSEPQDIEILAEDPSLKDYSLNLETWFEAAQRSFSSGDYNVAIQELSKCVEKDQHFYAAHDLLSQCHEALGNNEEARKYKEMSKQERRYIWKLQHQRNLNK